MKIEAGKYYRRRDGQVVGPAVSRNVSQTIYPWDVNGYFYKDDGGWNTSNPRERFDLISEVEVRDVLPFELRAGEKYNTVKPDGTPGPVVTLRRPSYSADSLYFAVPFTANYEGTSHFVKSCGEVFSYDGTEFRITSPYVEPKPPTIAERLEKQIEAAIRSPEMDALIAEIRRLEGGAK